MSQQTVAVLPAGSAALNSNTSAATAPLTQPSTSPGSQQLEEAAGLAAAAGAFAAASQSCSDSNTLRRGAGLLVLLRNGWRGKARPLNGSVLVRGVAYNCYSIVQVQLMSHEGVLLHRGQQQTVSVRVAAEFLGPGSSDAVGAWSEQTFIVAVARGHPAGCCCTARHPSLLARSSGATAQPARTPMRPCLAGRKLSCCTC